MNKNSRQTTLYYVKGTKLGDQCLATAQATDAQLLTINIASERVSHTVWAKMADQLNADVIDLIDQEHPVFREIYGDEQVSLKAKDAIKILDKHPETLVYPIAVRGDKAVQLTQANQLHSLVNPDGGDIPQG